MKPDTMINETLQPQRVLIGTCPYCGRVCVVLNNHGSWPLVECECGWTGATTRLANRARREHGWARTLRVYIKPGRPNMVRLPAGATLGVEAIDQADGAVIFVLPAHDGSTATTRRWFQWLSVLTDTNLVTRHIGAWGDAHLVELGEVF